MVWVEDMNKLIAAITEMTAEIADLKRTIAEALKSVLNEDEKHAKKQ